LTSFLMKMIMCPLVVVLASYIFPNVRFASVYQAITLGIVLAIIGAMMEYLFLREGTLWINTIMDFIASSIIIYLMSLFLTGARVTLTGAILTGVLLAVTEHFSHKYLIESGKTKKEPI
jgi:hypothetical protein